MISAAERRKEKKKIQREKLYEYELSEVTELPTLRVSVFVLLS